MSTTIANAPDKMGEYMLKGWVLTSTRCPTAGCVVPMMRSPKGTEPEVSLCVVCDSSSGAAAPSASATETESNRWSSPISGTSTPPTEISSALSSPTFAVPPESEESRQRREQSDRASREIGVRLLKGWAMLEDECPNTRCAGIPLVRPPSAASGKQDPRKECVICGTIYTSEADWAGRKRLVPADTPKEPSMTVNSSSNVTNGSPATVLMPTPQTRTADSPMMPIIQSLERVLSTLSQRLVSMSEMNADSGFDALAVGQTADALGKTAQALAQVRALR